MSNDLSMQFESIMNTLSVFKTQITSVQSQIKVLEKNVKKEMNSLQKMAFKNKNKGNKKPSGFAKPTKVTKELCEFMNKEEGSEIARTEVTRALISYIETNNLKNETNKRAEEKFEKWKAEYIAKHDNNTSTEVAGQIADPLTRVSAQPED